MNRNGFMFKHEITLIKPMVNFYGFFNTSLFIWGISFHNLKYLDKPIKCLEMRAKIKSVRKINEIFLCIFTYIWKLDIFSTYLNFDEKWFFGYFKSQISKCPIYTKILPPTLVHKKFPSQNDKLISFYRVLKCWSDNIIFTRLKLFVI